MDNPTDKTILNRRRFLAAGIASVAGAAVGALTLKNSDDSKLPAKPSKADDIVFTDASQSDRTLLENYEKAYQKLDESIDAAYAKGYAEEKKLNINTMLRMVGGVNIVFRPRSSLPKDEGKFDFSPASSQSQKHSIPEMVAAFGAYAELCRVRNTIPNSLAQTAHLPQPASGTSFLDFFLDKSGYQDFSPEEKKFLCDVCNAINADCGIDPHFSGQVSPRNAGNTMSFKNTIKGIPVEITLESSQQALARRNGPVR